MTLSGSCTNCGAPLASDQHHCSICGTRAAATRAPSTPAAVEHGAPEPVSRRGIPVPPQVAVVAAFLALGFGGLVGSSIGPGVDTLLAAAPATVASTDPTATVAAHTGGSSAHGGSGGSGSSPAAAAPSATAPVTPAATPTPASDPAPADVAPEDPAPADPAPADPGNGDPLPPDDSTLAQGTVVRVNPAAASYSLASGGALSTIHARDLPKAGSDVSVPTTSLFNGTLQEAGDRKESAGAKQATFSGTVTYADEEDGVYVVSSPGASIPVEAAKGEMPKLASAVTVVVDIGAAPDPADDSNQPASADEPAADDPGVCKPEEANPAKPIAPGISLTQDSFNVDFEELSSAGMEGIVQAVCPDLNQVVLSADDLRQSGADLTLTASKGIDLGAVEVGGSITAVVDPMPADDGSVSLKGLAGDGGVKGAGDKRLGQGDLAG